MIFITAKFQVKPEHADDWASISRAFTEATRAEAGCLWFDWSRSVENPSVYVLVEAFRDAEAGAAHVNSEHFKQALKDMPKALASTPKIISQTIDATGWSEMAELKIN